MTLKKVLYFQSFLETGLIASLIGLLPFIQKEFNLSLFEIGLLTAILSIFSIISAFSASYINKQIGNKGVFILSVSLLALSWLTLYFSSSKLPLAFSFILGGFGVGMYDPIISTFAVRNTEGKNRGKTIGSYLAAGDIGRIILLPFATFLISYVYTKTTSLIFFIISLIMLFVLIIIKTPKSSEVKVEKEKIEVPPFRVRHSKAFLSAVIAGMFDSFSSVSLFIFLPFLLVQKNIDLKTTGIFSAIFFSGYLLGRLVLGRLSDKYGQTKLIIFAESFMALLILALVFINNYWIIILILFLLGMFTRGTSPILKSMVADSLHDLHFEKGYGIYSSSVRTAVVISRPIFGAIAGTLGVSGVYYLSAFVCLLTIIPAITFFKFQNIK